MPSVVAPAATALLAGRPAASHARRPRTRTHAASASHLSPFVKTVTKFVGIVPLPARALIGALLAAALALAVRSRLTALRARRLERQRGQLLEDVGLLQAALLPMPPSRLGPVGASVAYRPADGPGAGGDFYDVFALEDGRVAAIVGDISGHGRQALPHTALVRFTLRAYLEAGLAPRQALQTAGEVLERQLGESFATVAVATYQPRDRLLTYASAGHPLPAVIGSRRVEPITVCSAPPIGVGMRTGTRQTLVSVPGCARVCLYTDGITEARVGSEMFGVERLGQALAALEPEAPASALLDRVTQETDARPDDMAACLLSIDGGSAAPRKLVEELELDAGQAAGDRVKRFLLECGIERREVAAILPVAHAEAERVGVVSLHVSLADGSRQVTLRPDNVAPIYVAHARRTAAGRATV